MRFVFGLIMLAVIGICTGRGGNTPSDVAGYARQLQSRVGTKVGLGKVKSIAADGDTLVVTVDGPDNWRLGHMSYMLTAPFLEGFCNSGRAKPYFQDGRKIRLDTLEGGGRRVRGDATSRCPRD